MYTCFGCCRNCGIQIGWEKIEIHECITIEIRYQIITNSPYMIISTRQHPELWGTVDPRCRKLPISLSCPYQSGHASRPRPWVPWKKSSPATFPWHLKKLDGEALDPYGEKHDPPFFVASFLTSFREYNPNIPWNVFSIGLFVCGAPMSHVIDVQITKEWVGISLKPPGWSKHCYHCWCCRVFILDEIGFIIQKNDDTSLQQLLFTNSCCRFFGPNSKSYTSTFPTLKYPSKAKEIVYFQRLRSSSATWTHGVWIISPDDSMQLTWYLEPQGQPFINGCYQWDDSKSSDRKWLEITNTSIYKWLALGFQVVIYWGGVTNS